MDERDDCRGNEPIESRIPPRRRLGRGLSALLGRRDVAAGQADSVEPSEHLQVAVDQIDPNPFQPRRDFDAETLKDLAESIRTHGVLQPLLVRTIDGRYQLIAGERRWRAAQLAGLETVPCRVMQLDDRSVCEVAIEENLKRKDLGVLEKAEAFHDYLQRFESSIEDLAGRLSMSRSSLSNTLRLLDLPEPVKQALKSERISPGHARALLPLEDADREALCRRIEKESLTVRETERAVRAIQRAGAAHETATVPFSAETATASDGPPESGMTDHILSLRDQLRQLLGVKVEIDVRGKETGRIVIPFGSNDEFENILRRLRRAA